MMAEAARDARLDRLLESDHRSDAHKARDRYRHPRETLAFFGLSPTQTVADIWPGSAGWTTEILAPYLRDHGRYIAAGYDLETETSFKPEPHHREYLAKLAARPDLYDRVLHGRVSQCRFDIAPTGSVDLILFLRLAHVFARNDALGGLFAAMFGALKPGGVLGLIEHRAPAGQARDPHALRGYMHQGHVIDMVCNAGFALEASSEINANPADTADHPLGVWNLPPWLWGGDKDRDKYLAIGESDRMTLRFRKPA